MARLDKGWSNAGKTVQEGSPFLSLTVGVASVAFAHSIFRIHGMHGRVTAVFGRDGLGLR